MLTSTSNTAVSSNTGFRSHLIIRVEYRGFSSREYVSVTYGSAGSPSDLSNGSAYKDLPEAPVVSIFLIPVARWIWTTTTPMASVSMCVAWHQQHPHSTILLDLPFLMSSPLMRRCKSKVRHFGATYSAAAVSIALEMNPEMKGRFITFGNARFIGTTEMVIRGRPMRATSVVFTLYSRQHRDGAVTKNATHKGGSGISCRRARAVPTAPVTSTHTARMHRIQARISRTNHNIHLRTRNPHKFFTPRKNSTIKLTEVR